MNKYFSEPWRYRMEEPKDGEQRAVVQMPEVAFDVTFPAIVTGEEAEQITRSLSAVPGLLCALEIVAKSAKPVGVCEMATISHNDLQIIRAAIKKARGE